MPLSLWKHWKPGRYRWPLRLALVLVAGVVLFLGLSGQWWQNRLRIINQAGQPIATLQVTVAGQTGSFHDIATGAEVNLPFRSQGQGNDRFTVEGRLAGEKETLIRGKGLLPEGATLIVLPGGQITIRQPGKT